MNPPHNTMEGTGKALGSVGWPCAGAQPTEPPQSTEQKAIMNAGSERLMTNCRKLMLRTLPSSYLHR